MLRCTLILLLSALLSACGSQEFRQLHVERQAAWQELLTLQQQRTVLTRNLLASARALPAVPPTQFARLEQTRSQSAALPVVSPESR